jgi:predicted HTH transcriptional regulator
MIDKEIFKGENQYQEFKQKLNQPEKIARTICGFANAKGGKLWVGIDDYKSVIGVDPEEEIFVLEKAAMDYCQPPVQMKIQIKYMGEEEVPVVLATIPESRIKPHGVVDEQGQIRYYLRAKDQTLPMGEMMRKMYEKGEIAPENEDMTLQAIESKIIKELKKKERLRANDIMKSLNISKKRTSRALYNLVRKGIISKFETEKQAFYTLLSSSISPSR